MTPGHDRTGAWTPFAGSALSICHAGFDRRERLTQPLTPITAVFQVRMSTERSSTDRTEKKAVTPTWGRGMGKAAVGVICADNRERPYLACSVLELASRHPSKRSNRSRVMDN